MTPAFGPLLKSWRERRRFSQLDLGLSAEVSARHLSFLEQGRAQPSRAMVLRLARHLDVPFVERNTMLTAAGFSGHFKARRIDEADMKPVRAAVERLLSTHMPFPAFAIDRYWRVVLSNPAAAAMFAAFAFAPDKPLYDLLLDPSRSGAFENLEELKRHMAQRLRTESGHLGGDPLLDTAAARLTAGLDDEKIIPAAATISTRVKIGDQSLAMFGMIAQFGSTEDIALADLKVELMFPADDTTRVFFETSALAG